MKKSVRALLVGIGLIVAATGASAQHATASSSSRTESLEEIVVTGSRVIQNGYEAPTPVTVLSAESLEQFAKPSIPDALREMPSLIKTTGPSAAQGLTGNDPSALTGSFLNLRNLGSQRMLLMEDSMRVPPTRADGLTDANVIPEMLVSRVEVVTGGASAAYGSDAVSGVVNYIMDNRFTGFKGLLEGGTSSRSDYKDWKVGFAAGGAFLDNRLHAVGSATYHENKGIDNFCDRPYGCDAYVYGGVNGGATGGLSAANPYVIYKNGFLSTLPYRGRISGVYDANNSPNAAANALLRNLVFDGPTGQSTRPFVTGQLINATTCINCEGSAWSPLHESLVPSQTTSQLYGHFDFELTPSVTLFGQASYAKSETRAQEGNTSWFGNTGLTTVMFSGNAYLPASVQSALTSSGATYFTLDSSRNQDIPGEIPGATFVGVNRNRAVTLGLKGEFGQNWKWKVYGTDSKSSQITGGRIVDNAHLAAAMDAVFDSAGNIVCRVTVTNPGLYPGCAPLNLLVPGAPSAAAVNYILTNYNANQTTTLKGYGGDIGGQPFSTWAGLVGVDVGAEYRKQALDVVSSVSDPRTTTGIRFQTMNQLPYRAINVFPTSGSYTVSELFAEANVPLAKDVKIGNMSIARSLNVDLAVRRTDYSTSGVVTSWKVGTVWQMNDLFRLRVTRSRDVRAPTLNDLFAPQAITVAAFTDIHTGNTFGSVTTQSQGNKDLKPELANTWTVGTVITPTALPGFTASVDWYNIQIGDAIQSFGAAQLVQACESSGGTSPLCSGVVRPFPFSNTTSANYPTLVYAQSYNAVQLIAKGYDVEASYRHPLLGGQLNLHALATYQYEYDSQTSPIVPLVNSAGYITAGSTPSPKLIANASIGYKKGAFGINVQERRIGSWSLAAPPGTLGTISYFQNPTVAAVHYTDLNLTYDFKVETAKRLQAYFNVNNLFDKAPPLLPPTNNPGITYPTQRSLYNVVMRDFTAGVRFQF